MIYYVPAMLAAMLLCRYHTRAITLTGGAEIKCFLSWKTAFLTLLPLTLLAVFRWDVGVDSLYGGTYWEAYQSAGIGINDRDFEWGFYTLMRLFAQWDVPFYWFLFALALLFMLCISVALSRGSVWTGWSLLAFFLLSFYFDCYSSLRQSLAEAVCLIGWAEMGFQPPSRKKDLRILLLFALAGLLHVTAWLCIPIYLVCKLRLSRTGLLNALVASILATPVLQAAISLAMRLFTDNPHYSLLGFARINALVTLILAGLCWYFHDGICALDENAYLYANQSLCIFVLLLNSGAMYLPYRVFDMLKIGYVFIVPYLLRGIRSGRMRLYIQIVLLLVFGVWFFNYFYMQDAAVADYRLVFSNWTVYSRLP